MREECGDRQLNSQILREEAVRLDRRPRKFAPYCLQQDMGILIESVSQAHPSLLTHPSSLRAMSRSSASPPSTILLLLPLSSLALSIPVTQPLGLHRLRLLLLPFHQFPPIPQLRRDPRLLLVVNLLGVHHLGSGQQHPEQRVDPLSLLHLVKITHGESRILLDVHLVHRFHLQGARNFLHRLDLLLIEGVPFLLLVSSHSSSSCSSQCRAAAAARASSVQSQRLEIELLPPHALDVLLGPHQPGGKQRVESLGGHPPRQTLADVRPVPRPQSGTAEDAIHRYRPLPPAGGRGRGGSTSTPPHPDQIDPQYARARVKVERLETTLECGGQRSVLLLPRFGQCDQLGGRFGQSGGRFLTRSFGVVLDVGLGDLEGVGLLVGAGGLAAAGGGGRGGGGRRRGSSSVPRLDAPLPPGKQYVGARHGGQIQPPQLSYALLEHSHIQIEPDLGGHAGLFGPQ
mmetsp:Transcript_21930/g.64759  ORF Transcript_21930/g.64759 Transcript_21930/m.64759 type:complete len:457 (+) Transcript_21930:352-1722(+)